MCCCDSDKTKPKPGVCGGDPAPEDSFKELGSLETAHTLIFKATDAGGFGALCCIFASYEGCLALGPCRFASSER